CQSANVRIMKLNNPYAKRHTKASASAKEDETSVQAGNSVHFVAACCRREQAKWQYWRLLTKIEEGLKEEDRKVATHFSIAKLGTREGGRLVKSEDSVKQ
ncbi:unnamed protein product, partial [Ceratitis capitata]